MPPVTDTYFLPRAKTKLVATQSLACDARFTNMVSDLGMSTDTGYDADPSRPKEVFYSAFGGIFTDAELGFTFAEGSRSWPTAAYHQEQAFPLDSQMA
jgi:hypothetical protein